MPKTPDYRLMTPSIEGHRYLWSTVVFCDSVDECYDTAEEMGLKRFTVVSQKDYLAGHAPLWEYGRCR